MAWTACVFTLFPDIYPGPLGVSKLKTGLDNNVWNLEVIDLKKFGDKHGRIDAPLCGGGAGMALRPDVFERAFLSLEEKYRGFKKVYFSPRGKRITQSTFKDNIENHQGLIFLCARYEGVDQRIIEYFGFEEWSLGDFILMGGDAAALTVIEGSVRLIPGIVQKEESVENESFEKYLLEHDLYTKPLEFQNLNVPNVLLSGNHVAIENFKREQSLKITKQRRSDLFADFMKMYLATDD